MDGSNQGTLAREVFRLQATVDELERLYLESDGVETDNIGEIEAFIASATTETIAALCEYLAEIEGRRELGKIKADQLRQLSDRLDRRERFAKRAIMDIMSKLDKRSVDAGTYSVSLVAGRDVALCDADFHDIAALPDDLVRVIPEKREPDKAKILAALKAKREVKGYILSKTAMGVRIR